MTFKLREEKKGALLFNQEKGSVEFLDEAGYREALKRKDVKVYKSLTPRKDLPDDCLSFPSKIYLEITRKCNLNCKNCYNKSNKPFEQELTTQELLKLIDEFSEKGCFELRLTGGEPTNHPDFFKITSYAKNKGLYLSLGTNAVWTKEFAEKVKDAGFNIIIVSLDGPKEVNDKIRGNGSFEKVIQSLNVLKRNKDLFLKLNMTLTRDNKDCLESVAKTAANNGIKVLNIAPLRFTGRATENKSEVLTKEEFYGIIKQVSVLREKYNIKIQTYFDILKPCKEYKGSLLNNKSCAAGIEAAVINPKGDVYGCAVSPAGNPEDVKGKELFTAGNVRSENFTKIWLDSKKWKAYRDLENNKSSDCKTCRHYSINCFGNCFVSSYLHYGSLNSKDPYCFIDLIKEKIE